MGTQSTQRRAAYPLGHLLLGHRCSLARSVRDRLSVCPAKSFWMLYGLPLPLLSSSHPLPSLQMAAGFVTVQRSRYPLESFRSLPRSPPSPVPRSGPVRPGPVSCCPHPLKFPGNCNWSRHRSDCPTRLNDAVRCKRNERLADRSIILDHPRRNRTHTRARARARPS